MFPNYCFHKNANDMGYEVVYFPKSTTYCDGKTSPSQCSERQSYTRTHSRTRQDVKHCDEDILSVVAVNSHYETKGLQPRSTCAVHRTQLIGRQPDKHRHVVVQRLNGGALCADQSVYLSCHNMKPQRQQLQQQSIGQQSIRQQSMQQQEHKQRLEAPSISKPPSHAQHSVRGLQDASADCFNIMYENVLKAVHGTVEQMLAKHFQCMVSRIQQLNAELIRQDHQLHQFKTETLRKINEHNEANLNQFKFISHMLVNNQKPNYRNQSQAKEEGERSNAGADVLNPQTYTFILDDDSRQQEQQQKPQSLKPSQEEEQKQKRKPIQHQLWQQQDLRRYGHAARKPSSVPRKSERTNSLPDLHRMTSSCNHRRNIQKGAKCTATPTQRIQRYALHAVNESPRFSTPKRKCQCKSRPPTSLQSCTPVRNH